jgi:type II secretory pathway pseudopilin PulG
MRRRDTRLGMCCRSDDGFTIVEGLVAMALVVLFFVAFTTTVSGALRGSRNARLTQTATAVVVDHLEAVRGFAWHEVAMTEVDLEAPLIDEDGLVLVGEDAGLPYDEPLFVSAFGIISPKVTEVVENTEYTVWTYVSETPEEMRRIVVLVTWEYAGEPKRFQSSTLVAEPAAEPPEES